MMTSVYVRHLPVKLLQDITLPNAGAAEESCTNGPYKQTLNVGARTMVSAGSGGFVRHVLCFVAS